MFLELLLKYYNSNSNIFLLQDFNTHLSFMALIVWITKDEALILISFLGVNRLFYVAGNSYPTTKSPQRLTLLLQHGLVSEIGHKFRTKLVSIIITISQHLLSPKILWSSHKTTGILLRTKHISYPVQNP